MDVFNSKLDTAEELVDILIRSKYPDWRVGEIHGTWWKGLKYEVSDSKKKKRENGAEAYLKV